MIDDVSMELCSGTVVGLRGINGSGKTMLLRLLAGLIYPSSGTITVDDAVLGKTISSVESTGLLIENPAYTGFDNLKILTSLKGKVSADTIAHTLQSTGLDPQDKRTYKKYSLGMKQRLGLAAAFVESPQLILLDEPTNALDEGGISLFRTLVQTHQKQNALIVLACHDLAILQDLCDEIYTIQDGTIQAHTKKSDEWEFPDAT